MRNNFEELYAEARNKGYLKIKEVGNDKEVSFSCSDAEELKKEGFFIDKEVASKLMDRYHGECMELQKKNESRRPFYQIGFLVLMCLIAYVLINKSQSEYTNKDLNKNKELFIEESQKYYNECRDNGGSHATCESYAINRNLDNKLNK